MSGKEKGRMKEVYEGLQILLRYDPDGEIGCEGSMLFATPASKTKEMDVGDFKKLHELNWFIIKEFECWAKCC